MSTCRIGLSKEVLRTATTLDLHVVHLCLDHGSVGVEVENVEGHGHHLAGDAAGPSTGVTHQLVKVRVKVRHQVFVGVHNYTRPK